MKFYIALIVSILFSAIVHGNERPGWIDRLPKSDSSFSYYIGRSSDFETEAEAFTLATINAREQAITHNFGVFTQIKSETFQTLDSALSSQNYEAISQQVRLEEFEQVDFYLEKKNIWILYKYKKVAIDQEKKRLAEIKQEIGDSFSFMISGNQENAKINGTLEVTSSPSGAPVRIDGISKIGDLELRTPLRLMGLFSAGKHTIEIDDPKFELIQKEVILFPGLTAKVDSKLVRAFGEISISCETEGATVFLGTKLIGTTPLDQNIQIMAENSASIEIRHPEMETYRSHITVERGEKQNNFVSLTPRPSTISISSEPRSAAIEIDGQLQDKMTPSGQIKISRGDHKIRVFKDGLSPYETSVFIKGNENVVLPNIRLENAPEKPAQKEMVMALNAPPSTLAPKWTLGLGYLAGQSTAKNVKLTYSAPGLLFRIQPWRFLGFELSVYYGESSVENKLNTTQAPNYRETTVVKIGAPLTIYRHSGEAINGGFSLIPEYMSVTNDYINRAKGSSDENKIEFPSMRIKQTGRGGSLEYKLLKNPKDNSKFYFGTSFKSGYHKYSSTKEIEGSKSLSLEIDFIIGF